MPSEGCLKGQSSFSISGAKARPALTGRAVLRGQGTPPWLPCGGSRRGAPEGKEAAHPAAGVRAAFMQIHNNNNNFTRELTYLSRLCQVYVPDGPCLLHLIYCGADQLCLRPGQAHIWQPVGKNLCIQHSCPHILFPRAILFLSVKVFYMFFSSWLISRTILNICQQQICLSTFMLRKGSYCDIQVMQLPYFIVKIHMDEVQRQTRLTSYFPFPCVCRIPISFGEAICSRKDLSPQLQKMWTD